MSLLLICYRSRNPTPDGVVGGSSILAVRQYNSQVIKFTLTYCIFMWLTADHLIWRVSTGKTSRWNWCSRSWHESVCLKVFTRKQSHSNHRRLGQSPQGMGTASLVTVFHSMPVLPTAIYALSRGWQRQFQKFGCLSNSIVASCQALVVEVCSSIAVRAINEKAENCSPWFSV